MKTQYRIVEVNYYHGKYYVVQKKSWILPLWTSISSHVEEIFAREEIKELTCKVTKKVIEVFK